MLALFTSFNIHKEIKQIAVKRDQIIATETISPVANSTDKS